MSMFLRGKIIIHRALQCMQQQFTLLEKKAIAAIGSCDNQPTFAFDLAQTDVHNHEVKPQEESPEFDDGILWGVPTCRRTVEKRMSRRLSSQRVFRLKKNILTCPVCYSYHEAHTICGKCYAKVKAETLAMQEAIQKELKYEPIDREVAVYYKGGEKPQTEGKRIVEINRTPPAWFSKNLLTRGYLPKEQSSEVSQPNQNIKVLE